MPPVLEGGKLAWEYSSVRRCACESLHKVICNINYLRPLKTVPHVCAAHSVGGLVPHPCKPLLGRVWQEGHAEWQPYEIACALYEYLNPSTLSPLQCIRKGGTVSGLAYSKETCLWAGGKEAVTPSGADGALWDCFLQSSVLRVFISGCLLLPHLLAPSWLKC